MSIFFSNYYLVVQNRVLNIKDLEKNCLDISARYSFKFGQPNLNDCIPKIVKSTKESFKKIVQI